MWLRIKPSPGNEDIIHELYQYHGAYHTCDSGLDLFCLQDTIVPNRAIGFKIPLGICCEAFIKQLPSGFYLYPRSSLGSKTPIRLSNSVGIIDSGYRGEIIAIVDNISDEPFTLKARERYFQIVGPDLKPVSFELCKQLTETTRGNGGFGSTG